MIAAPARAMLWQLWRRHRWGLALDAAYLLLAAAIVRLLPFVQEGTPLRGVDLPAVGHCLAAPCQFVFLHLAAMFSFSSVSAAESGFPRRMFVLPVSTRTLVAWPMALGGLSVAGVWWLMVWLILRPSGVDAAAWWPAAVGVLGMAVLQAVSWLPLAQSWLRVYVAVLLFMAFFSAVAFGAALSLPTWSAAATAVALLPVAYAIAAGGVRRARRGDIYDWRLWQRLVDRFNAWRSPAGHPFSSPARAQLWFELRGHGWTLPALVTAIQFLVTVSVLFLDTHNVAASWKRLAFVLSIPMLTAGLLSGSLGRQDSWSKYAVPVFLATRPMSSASLVGAKLRMAAASTLLAWIPNLLVLPLLLSRPGFFDAILQTLQSVSPVKAALAVFAAMVGPVLLTWINLVINLWIGLSGRTWVVNGVPLAFALLACAAGGVGFWIYLHPEWSSPARAAVPYVLAALVAAKLCAACWVLRRLVRARLIEPRTIALLAGLWCAAVACAYLIAAALLPAESLALGSALATLILVVPFSRLAGAPLALAWNRHR